jgi:hypothetical protein
MGLPHRYPENANHPPEDTMTFEEFTTASDAALVKETKRCFDLYNEVFRDYSQTNRTAENGLFGR